MIQFIILLVLGLLASGLLLSMLQLPLGLVAGDDAPSTKFVTTLRKSCAASAVQIGGIFSLFIALSWLHDKSPWAWALASLLFGLCAILYFLVMAMGGIGAFCIGCEPRHTRSKLSFKAIGIAVFGLSCAAIWVSARLFIWPVVLA